jgi:hypothetical protein
MGKEEGKVAELQARRVLPEARPSGVTSDRPNQSAFSAVAQDNPSLSEQQEHSPKEKLRFEPVRDGRDRRSPRPVR